MHGGHGARSRGPSSQVEECRLGPVVFVMRQGHQLRARRAGGFGEDAAPCQARRGLRGEVLLPSQGGDVNVHTAQRNPQAPAKLLAEGSIGIRLRAANPVVHMAGQQRHPRLVQQQQKCHGVPPAAQAHHHRLPRQAGQTLGVQLRVTRLLGAHFFRFLPLGVALSASAGAMRLKSFSAFSSSSTLKAFTVLQLA